jgi:hypothetical protein
MVAQSKSCPPRVNTAIELINRTTCDGVCVSTDKRAGIVRRICYFFSDRSFNSKRQFLDCASTAFSERYIVSKRIHSEPEHEVSKTGFRDSAFEERLNKDVWTKHNASFVSSIILYCIKYEKIRF